MKSVLRLCVLLLIYVAVPACFRAVETQAEEPVEIPELLRECAGLLVAEYPSGRVIAECNADRPYIPASVTKALTAAAVISLCDSDERFVTRIDVRGPVKDGVLRGNVILRACGDPTIGSRHIKADIALPAKVAECIAAAGIDSVAGRVFIDQSAFIDDGVPPGWMDEDLLWPYGAALFGANYRDNTVSVAFPGARTSPVTPSLEIDCVGGKGSPRLSRRRGSRTLTVTGRIPRRGFAEQVANPAPWSAMRHAVTEGLKDAGIGVGNAALKITGAAREIGAYRSPRYIDIMRSMVVRSDNLMAEGMLRALAPGESRRGALEVEAEVWSDYDVDTGGIVIEDGSGLSRDNRLTARFLAEVLAIMARGSVAPGYLRLFPRAGREGSLRNFMKGTELEGRLGLKTGSMRGVQSYAGYMFDDKGAPTHVIVFMANGFKDRGQVRAALSSLLTDLLGDN